MNFPEKLHNKLANRIDANALRKLTSQSNLIDFSSNDYIGFSKSEFIFQQAHQYLVDHKIQQNGATGSRLLSGNHELYEKVENALCKFHNSESATIFNSGYDANLGFFSSVPQRGDIILYDEVIHASIRDGIRLSNAKAYSFKHNDINHLELMLQKFKGNGTVYVVTESVFSMDGDAPDLISLVKTCKKHHAFIIIDEAHALGVFGQHGCGLIQELGLEQEIFARIVTFGKGLGCHGACILGTAELKQYLVNFARSFIYTTALPPHSLATIKIAYEQLVIMNQSEESSMQKLKQNIQFFNQQLTINEQLNFIKSNSAIHCCIISGNEKVKTIAQKLQENGFNIKPILSPTVPQGEERLRLCLHSYNSKEEISKVLELLSTFVT